MCPLRLILIFLSATLAGIFVLRNFRNQPKIDDEDEDLAPTNPKISDSSNASSNENSKVRAVIESGFWTFVDMASGRYLWRHMVSSSSKKSSWWCVLGECMLGDWSISFSYDIVIFGSICIFVVICIIAVVHSIVVFVVDFEFAIQIMMINYDLDICQSQTSGVCSLTVFVMDLICFLFSCEVMNFNLGFSCEVKLWYSVGLTKCCVVFRNVCFLWSCEPFSVLSIELQGFYHSCINEKL